MANKVESEQCHMWFVATKSATFYAAALQIKSVPLHCQRMFRNPKTEFVRLWGPLTQIPCAKRGMSPQRDRAWSELPVETTLNTHRQIPFRITASNNVMWDFLCSLTYSQYFFLKILRSCLISLYIEGRWFNLADHSGRAVLSRLEHWDHGFEIHSRHGCLSMFILFVLPCVGSDFATDCSLVQGVLPTVYKIIHGCPMPQRQQQEYEWMNKW
jgi:hypothetical protein